MDRFEERDRQLEEKIATATQKLETKIAARRAALRGNAPLFIPTTLSHKSPTPKEKQVHGEAKVRRETQAYWGRPAHHGSQARRGPQARPAVRNEGTWPSSRRCIVMDIAKMRLSAAPWLRFLSSMKGEEMEVRRPEQRSQWCK